MSKSEGIRPGRMRGSWEIRVELPRDPGTGRRRQKSKTVYGTRAEAERCRRRMLRELDLTDGRGLSGTTVGQVFDRWLRDVKASRSRNYYRSCETFVRLYVKPALGARRLSELSKDDVRRAYARWGQAVGTNTLVNKHRMLHAALNFAVDEGLISRNPADRLKMPARLDRPPTIYDYDQLVMLFEAAGQDPYWGPMVKLSVYTGMREGELLQLTWDNVDFANRLISISWRTKTRAGRRAIRLIDEAVDLLKEVQRRQADDKAMWGEAERDGPRWVFRNFLGRKHDPSRLWRAFDLIQKAAGLPHIRFHDLRHSTATTLLKLGVDVRIVQEILGHSNSAVTRDIYQHVTAGMQDDAMAKLGAFLRGGEKSVGSDAGGAAQSSSEEAG